MQKKGAIAKTRERSGTGKQKHNTVLCKGKRERKRKVFLNKKCDEVEEAVNTFVLESRMRGESTY